MLFHKMIIEKMKGTVDIKNIYNKISHRSPIADLRVQDELYRITVDLKILDAGWV